MLFKKNKDKIFCIGFGKTGTTTLEKTLKEFNFKLGDQNTGELLVFDWFNKDFSKILELSKTAEAFQDVPFCLPYTYIFLDQYFPKAKFILTERNTSDQWYNSIVKFHSKLWSDGTNPPSKSDLMNAKYRYKGYAYDSFKLLFNTSDEDLYNKDKLIESYLNHNYIVKEYFRYKPEKLLTINVSKKSDYFRLCDFLNKKPLRDSFPWENKTNEK